MNLAVDRILYTQLVINSTVVKAIDQVTMVGLESVASCLGSPHTFPYPWMPFIALGQGELGVSSEDTHLEREIIRKYCTNVYSVRNSYRVQTLFGVDEPEDAYILREVGIFDELVGSKLAVRWLLEEDIEVAAADEVNCTCIIWIGS